MEKFNKDSKPQKFFLRDLSLDLKKVSDTLKLEYDRIAKREMYGIAPHNDSLDIFTYSKSLSTQKSREYNAFQMYYPFMHELYSAVVSMTQEACKYYDIDYNSEQWYTQAWFNINSTAKGGKLDWHDHIDPAFKIPSFHGYYCVNAEPSETHYKIGEEIKTNINKNNRAILSLMGYPHAMGDWAWEGERITIAYDVVSIRTIRQEAFLKSKLKNHEDFWEQHYFPLPTLKSFIS